MPKSAGTEILHSTGQTETGSETVLITMVLWYPSIALSILLPGKETTISDILKKT